jgi:sugar phosphate isomerase/epimerase
MNRRNWLRTALVATASASSAPFSRLATNYALAANERASSSDPRGWRIGVFNRAWASWSLDETLKAIKSAGFSTLGLIGTQQKELLTGNDATPASLDEVKRKIADAGLQLVNTALRFQENDSLPKLRDDVYRQLDNSARLGARYVMTFGVDRQANFTKFERVMMSASARAEAANIRIVIKPHGGITLGPPEILKCIERVSHPNFSLWYDPGNILHYTGADPVQAYTTLAKYVTGFCAKDCGAQGGEVMMSFGEGKVDFTALLTKMSATGFDGPIMIEGIKVGKTAAETAENAKKNRLVLERVIATVPAQ